MFYNKLKMDSVAEEVAKIIAVDESYDDEDDDVAKADRELARMKAKPIHAAKIDPDKDKIKKTSKDKEEEKMDEELKGSQHKLDVAKPKGKLTAADFKKLRKEESELDERTLTSGESKEKEHYVKSMKKNLKGFKQRYGERAKEVMYATATKMAKEEADQIDELSVPTMGSYFQKSLNQTMSGKKDRTAGMQKAYKKMTTKPKPVQAEEVEQIDEAGDKELGNMDTRTPKELKKQIRDLDDKTLSDWHKDSGPHWLKPPVRKMQDKLVKSEVRRRMKKEEVVQENYGDMSHAAKELVLHADNDHHLHYSSHQPIIKNLSKKMKKGTYHPEKAKKLWQYHADRAAQSYAKQHGDGTPWHKMFSVSDRKHAASHWEDMHRHELNEAAGPTSDYSMNSTFATEANPSSTPMSRVKQAAHSAMKRIKDKLGMQKESLLGAAMGTDEGEKSSDVTTDVLPGRVKGNNPKSFLHYKAKLKGDIKVPSED